MTFTWSVPNGSTIGNHVVELTGATSGSVDATFEVYTSTGGGALSPTGGDMALPLGGLAAAMLLAGAGVWFAVRRRAHA
ncbi:MAG: LPXTG cell wall anchor domain-containing protein [Microbacterium gubbeenense]|uniref:LPXTG cell wall anchor domain-containing protein n=1 Tax=Microbacterium gubbeenense TaxID=159896 RepID=UPI003F9656BB